MSDWLHLRADTKTAAAARATTSWPHRKTHAVVRLRPHSLARSSKQRGRMAETRQEYQTHDTLTHTSSSSTRCGGLTESKLTRAKMAKVEMLSHTHLVLNEWTGTALQLRADHEPSREELHEGGGRGEKGRERGRGGERLGERREHTSTSLMWTHLRHLSPPPSFVENKQKNNNIKLHMWSFFKKKILPALPSKKQTKKKHYSIIMQIVYPIIQSADGCEREKQNK